MRRLLAKLRWDTLARHLSGTLIVSVAFLLAAQAIIQIQLQDGYARRSLQDSALRLSDVLYSALHSAMLANDRQRLHDDVHAIAERSPTTRIRVLNKEGVVVFSSAHGEEGRAVDLSSEACIRCHGDEQPLSELAPGDRVRRFAYEGLPAIGVIRPIDNEPACAVAGCHAGPEKQRLLGVLDVTLQMTEVERRHEPTVLLMGGTATLALVFIVLIVLAVVRNAVHRPLGRLIDTLDRIGKGDYTARHTPERITEFDRLGDAVNQAARDLEKANADLVVWAQSLERRVDAKTEELRVAQEQMLAVERMASLGRLAAVVAHEINNPLASVLVYSRLLLKRVKGRSASPRVGEEDLEILDGIASESARCGEIVSNLLTFARQGDTRMEPTEINPVIRRVVFLLKHMMDLEEVEHRLELDPEVGEVLVDPSRFEQALLGLCVNAIDAMSGGGVLTLSSRPEPPSGVRIEIRDTGVGIPQGILDRIFEPFFTTKDHGDERGLGLGLAVVYGIVQRHGGTIDVESSVGQGTRFVLVFPGRPTPDLE
ncbi:MAG: ATP-binding protein [Deltaproteobacteria bacterium]|nr:ATP-binding protein [Deltaproteobacteria bacterium]